MIDIDKLLADELAVLTNTHVVFTSGKHGDAYVNLRVFAHKTDVLRQISEAFAQRIMSDFLLKSGVNRPEEDFLFLGPETLGRDLARLTSVYYNETSSGRSESIFCAPNAYGDMDFSDKLGFAELVSGRKLIYVDDLMNESTTYDRVKKLVDGLGGEIVLACTIVNRQPDKNTADALGVKELIALKTMSDMKAYAPDECPLCKAKVPMVLRPGHGYKFIQDNPTYPVMAP